MDRDTLKLRKNILVSIEEFISEYGKLDEGIEFRSIVDETKTIYQLIIIGWQGVERIYHVLFHLEIKGQKIWIQEDNTEIGIATFLLKNGLSKQDIVLAFYSEPYRHHTEFAVGS